MKFTGTAKLVQSQKILVFFSYVLIWFVLATREKEKKKNKKNKIGTESSHEPESQCQICHPCFYFEVGFEGKKM